MTDVRVITRHWAIHEITDKVRDERHWIIATTPHTAERVAYAIKDAWQAIAYLDSSTDVVLVGDRRIVQATTALNLFEICVIYIIPKALVTANELNTVYERISSTKIPENAAQDILMFSEPLDGDIAATYTPTIILEVAGLIDGKNYLKEWTKDRPQNA